MGVHIHPKWNAFDRHSSSIHNIPGNGGHPGFQQDGGATGCRNIHQNFVLPVTL